MRTPNRSQLLVAIAALTVAGTSIPAQQAPADSQSTRAARSLNNTRLQGGLTIDVAQPVGAFRDHVESGIGIGGHGLLRLDARGALSLRFDASFMNYGRESYRLPLGQGPVGVGIPLDRETLNNVISLGIGPQWTATRGALRPYVTGSAGVAFFTTNSSLTGHQDMLNYRYDVTVTDTRFAWTGGTGVLVPIWARARSLGLLDVGVRYQNSGQATRYLRKGGVRDLPDGAVQLDMLRGRADFLTWHAGVSVRKL